MSLFNALIRTHHITSRKKVAKLKQAADALDIFALLRYGGCPGIMYVEGDEKGVRQWVEAVHVGLHSSVVSFSFDLVYPICIFGIANIEMWKNNLRTCVTKTINWSPVLLLLLKRSPGPWWASILVACTRPIP